MLKEQLSPAPPPQMPPSGFDPKYGDRILGWCLLASILINLAFGLWLSTADIYGVQRQSEQNKMRKIQVYKPPIKQKPKPKPKIIPPKPKIIPKVVHLRPQPQPRPLPPRPAPPQHFTVGHHSTSKTAIVTEAPPPPVQQQQPTQPVNPENTTVAPTPPAPPPPTPPAPRPEPKPEPKPEPPAPRPEPKPAPPPPKPKGYVDVESRDPSINESSIQTPDTSDLDPPPSHDCVISCEVDENGHLSSPRIKRSSGNAQFDARCQDAIRRGRGTPGVQDHIIHRQPVEYTFSV